MCVCVCVSIYMYIYILKTLDERPRTEGQNYGSMEARRRCWFVGRENRWGGGTRLADRAAPKTGAATGLKH